MTHRDAEPHTDELAIEPFAASAGVCGIAVAGAADLRGAPTLGAAIGEALDGGCRRLLVDLSAASFVDSSCLGTLLGAQRRMRQRGGAIAIVCTEPHIMRIFELTLLDRVFLMCSDREEAVARLRESVAEGEPAAVSSSKGLHHVAPLAFDTDEGDVGASDEIRLEVPVVQQFATVPRLVLGGVGSRFDLPVDRLEELQLAFEAVAAHEASGPTLELVVLVSSDRLRVRAGRFADDPLEDAGTRRAVAPLVEATRSGRDDAGHWVELVVSAPRRSGNGTQRT